MKKIFRMALVFALAGATLMYTGCSKDYSEDINSLDKEVSALGTELGTKYQDLLNQLNSAKTSLEAAYKAADKDLSDSFNTKINGIQNDINGINAALAKKADQAAVDAAISQLQKDVEAELAELRSELEDAAAELEETAEALREEVQKNLKDFYDILAGELRALVFVPDFYFAGIEATSYSVADFGAYVINALKGDNEFIGQKVTFSKGAKLGVIPESIGTVTDPAGTDAALPFVSINDKPVKKDGKYVPYSYTKGANSVAYYSLNPSSFPVEDAKWALWGNDRTIVNVVNVKGDAPKVWAPKVLSVASEDGVAAVTFEIVNPELLVASTITLDKEDETLGLGIDKENHTATALGNAPVMQLVATLKDGKTISSDWEAIVPDVDALDHLAFTKESKYTTTIACGSDKIVLYPGAFQTLENDPSIAWKYNAGPLDLAKVIKIHMTSSVSGEDAYTFEEFSAKYPGFTMNFEEVPYTIGDEKTSEDSYSALEGSVFTPCYVDEKGNSVVIAKDANYGISAVGRLPMFLVTLCEPSGNVVLHGYFKVEITPEDAVYTIKPIDVKNFGKVPYLCSTELSTKWYEFSANVLENLKVDYKQFIGTYKVYQDGKLTQIEQGNTYELPILVWDAEKKDYVEPTVYNAKTKKNDPVSLGKITYSVDATGNGVNDSFTWSFSLEEAANVALFKDVYVLFMVNEYTGAAFKFSADIAEPAEVTYGKINPSYWFEDIEEGVQNTVRANVIVPETGAEDVKVFQKDLDEYFAENQLKVQLSEESQAIYGKFFDGKDGDDYTTDYSYKFAAEQPVINGIPLIASEDGKYLYTAKMKANGTPDLDANGKLQIHSLIASFNGKSVLKYTNETTRAKELLNLWGKEEKDVEKILYANIQVDFAAGDPDAKCVIAKGSDVFHIRFIRPLSVVGKATDGLADAIPGGDVIYLGNLINAIDWNDNEPDMMWSFVKKDAKVVNTNGATPKVAADGFYADTYTTAAGKDIIWFKYYGFQSIKIDSENVMLDQAGPDQWELLKKYNPKAEAYLAQKSGDKFEEVAGGETSTLTVDKTTFLISGLTDYVFFYKNNQGVTKDFNLKVPVEINYSWGTLKAEVIIPVSKTYAE